MRKKQNQIPEWEKVMDALQQTPEGQELIDIQYEDNCVSGLANIYGFETANILFANNETRVNITGDSIPAMLIDIGKALYKEG